MYVRWKKRAQTRYHKKTGEYSLTAVLVASSRILYRDQPSEPRQTIIKYLGTIGTQQLKYTGQRARFWQDVTEALDSLRYPLKPDARTRAEAAIIEVVPRPSAEEAQQAKRDFDALTASFRGAR